MTSDIKSLTHLTTRLKQATHFGLQYEVVFYALKAMKENNELSVEQAIDKGCDEWDLDISYYKIKNNQ